VIVQVGVTSVQVSPGLVRYTSRAMVDADGAPNAYSLDDRGLDALGNAYDSASSRWVGVVCSDGACQHPVVQGPNDPFPGFLLAATALQDHRFAVTDPRRYVDATRFCFISVSPELTQLYGVHMGDLCWVSYGGRGIGAVVCDVGPHKKLGEISVAGAVGLGIPSSPRNGGVVGGVDYCIFPGTASDPAWPHGDGLGDVQMAARNLAIRYGLLDAAG
jgi:hypothetical protein